MVRQFDVVANPDRDDAGHRPYLIVLQSDLVSNLRSTVVAPLIARNQMLDARQLNPVVGVDGQEYWVAIYELFAIERRLLGKTVMSAAEQRDENIAAIDFLFRGF
jgi:toxin CcdB